MKDEEKSNVLKEDIEYLIIQDKKTNDVITKITKNNILTTSDVVVRIKYTDKKD